MSSDQSSELRQTVPKRSENCGQNEVNSNTLLEVLVFLMNGTSIDVQLKGRASALTVNDVLSQVYKKSQNSDQINLNFNEKYKDLFSLWITSPYLEIQLHSSQKPFCFLAKWDYLLRRHGPTQLITDPILIEKDEPTLSFQRNVFYDKELEREISDADIGALYLLYYESKLNVLDGRYPIQNSSDSFEQLAAYQAAIELGKHNKTDYTDDYFRQHLNEYIPLNYIKGSDGNKFNGLIRTLSRSTPSVKCAQKIHKKYKEISDESLSECKLLRSYLDICWDIPCYGSAYFSAQIERPIKSKIDSLINHFDLEVWVAINQTGLHIISKEKPELLLSIDHMDLVWAVGCPKTSEDPNCIPCIIVEIPTEEQNENSSDNTQKASNILQIFSRQYRLIEVLLTNFINKTKNTMNSRNSDHLFRKSDSESFDVIDGAVPPPQQSAPIYMRQTSCNSKVYRPERLSFAKFDTSGQVLNKTGSWVRSKKDKN